MGSQAKTYSVAGQPNRPLFDLSGLESSGQDYTDVGEAAYEQQFESRRLSALQENAKSLGYNLVPVSTAG